MHVRLITEISNFKTWFVAKKKKILFLIAWREVVVSHFTCMHDACAYEQTTCMWTEYMHVDRLHVCGQTTYMWTDCMYVDILKQAPLLITICLSVYLYISPLFFIYYILLGGMSAICLRAYFLSLSFPT